MIRPLEPYRNFQVFLNYPYDTAFEPYADALAFCVVATGLIPVCALDLSLPDRPRLQTVVEAVASCEFSAHDLSRASGYGDDNLSRMNMPLEMGMALFHALRTQHLQHRCAFFVPDAHTYQKFASDLAGLDPLVYDNDCDTLIRRMFDWLRTVAPAEFRSEVPTVHVIEAFGIFRSACCEHKGSEPEGQLSHAERREVMYQLCTDRKWWDWRGTRAGRQAFPEFPLA